jgi:transitional endoplasmic reticulum ATPase
MSQSTRSGGAHALAFDAIGSHFGAQRISTELEVYNALRAHYPDSEIVVTPIDKCDLHGYAEAGLATVTASHGNDHDISRAYRAPTLRRDDNQGKLNDHTRLGRWEYVWEGNSYIYYHVEYTTTYEMKATALYILAPKSAASPNPDAASTDAVVSSADAKERIDKLLKAVAN